MKTLNLKKYLTLTRMGIIESLQFRIGTFVMIIGNLLYLTLVYFLWKAIFASSGTDRVNGMTFYDTLVYLVLATALYGFMEMYTVWEIGRNIQSGKIVLDLLKPIKYKSYLFWSYSGELLRNFICVFLPTFLVVCIVTHGAVPLGINLLFFIVSVIMGVIISYNIDYIVFVDVVDGKPVLRYDGGDLGLTNESLEGITEYLKKHKKRRFCGV